MAGPSVDGLSVEVKILVVGICVEQIQQPIDERHEPETELLVRQIPFAIPMRVRDHVDVEHDVRSAFDRAGGEAGDEVALEQDEHGDDRHERDEARRGE